MPNRTRQDAPVRTLKVERRQFGRIRQDELYCSLGEIEDLSAGGMRLRCRRVPRGQVKAGIRSRSGVEIEVLGQVVWRRRLGIGRHLIGVRFGPLPPETMQKLSRIATEHRVHASMRLLEDYDPR